MGRIRRLSWTRIVLAALACLAGQTGCRTLSDQQDAIPAMRSVAGQGQTSRSELPAREAAQVCIATAETLAEKGQFPEAIALYEKARQADPSQTHLCRPLALLYDQSGNFNQALEEYAKAMELDPTDSDLFNDLGYAYYNRGQLDKAEHQLRQAVQLDPENKRAWVNLGMTYAQQNRCRESLEAFEQAVPAGQARANVAFVLMSQGRYEEARLGYEAALRLEPTLDVARGALARLDRVERPLDAAPSIPDVGVRLVEHRETGPSR